MALVKKKQSTEGKGTSTRKKKVSSAPSVMRDSSAYMLVRKPRITEKSTILSERGVYTFDVAPRANKTIVANFIRQVYGVAPKKIRIVSSVSKQTFIRGRYGVRAGAKKAYVYLKKGDKIEFV